MRFDRDRRGYETTALVQPAVRGRGKRLLYWFRTPPGVRVGRAPIDETAIRLLEQHNPDVQFDWTRILKAPPGAEPPRRDARDGRDRDQRGRREPRATPRPRTNGAPPPAQPVSRTPPPPFQAQRSEPVGLTEEQIRAAEVAHQHAERAAEPAQQGHDTKRGEAAAPWRAPEPSAAAEPGGSLEQDHAGIAEPTQAGLRPPPQREFEAPRVFEVGPEDVGSASYLRLGAEGLVRLRARYAEVMARIAEPPLEEAAREELKLRAERLNPDAWVTADEVTAALEQYETVFEALRVVVGRHPRQRRRTRR